MPRSIKPTLDDDFDDDDFDIDDLIDRPPHFLILASRWNPQIVDTLVQGAHKALLAKGVTEDRIEIVRVPGAWELPVVASVMAESMKHDAIIALGCVVRGETRHFEHVADQCARALMDVSLDHQLPIANGVLAVETIGDAQARAGGAYGNKGEEAALVALEMAELIHNLGKDNDQIADTIANIQQALR